MLWLSDSLIKQGDYLCKMVDCILGFDKHEDIIEKYKSYCNYLLSMDKDYVNKEFNENYYEKCEDFLRQLNQISYSVTDEREFMNKMEFNLFNKTLEVCKKVESELKDDILFNLEKCYTYSRFVKNLRSEIVSKDLILMCDSFIDGYNRYLKYKEIYTNNHFANDKIKKLELKMKALKELEDKQKTIDMENMRVTEI